MEFNKPRPDLFPPLKIGDKIEVIEHEDKQTHAFIGKIGYITEKRTDGYETVNIDDKNEYCFRYEVLRYDGKYIYEIAKHPFDYSLVFQNAPEVIKQQSTMKVIKIFCDEQDIEDRLDGIF